MAVQMDVVQKSGSWFSYNGERLGQGRENIKEMLMNKPELVKEIEAKVREKLNG
jgi:recombination protein RecA